MFIQKELDLWDVEMHANMFYIYKSPQEGWVFLSFSNIFFVCVLKEVWVFFVFEGWIGLHVADQIFMLPLPFEPIK